MGPIGADLARQLAEAYAGGQWRYALADVDRQLSGAGRLGRRPDHLQHRRRDDSGATVELQAHVADIDGWLDNSEVLAEWQPVLSEIRRRYRARDSPPVADKHRRFPSADMRLYIEIRDRQCTFPGCRVPARRADVDHTHDHAAGGLTEPANLGPQCRHDHRLKHAGRWQLTQPGPGEFTWHSPLGHTYPSYPLRIIDNPPPY